MPKQEIKAKIDKGEATNEFSLSPFIFLFTVRTAITANLKWMMNELHLNISEGTRIGLDLVCQPNKNCCDNDIKIHWHFF